MSAPVQIMGVLNVTPDSFSDGGRWQHPDDAIAHAVEMSQAGAAIIDVGGESTRPGATPVEAPEERRRVIPIVRELVAERGGTDDSHTVAPPTPPPSASTTWPSRRSGPSGSMSRAHSRCDADAAGCVCGTAIWSDRCACLAGACVFAGSPRCVNHQLTATATSRTSPSWPASSLCWTGCSRCR